MQLSSCGKAHIEENISSYLNPYLRLFKSHADLTLPHSRLLRHPYLP